MANSSEFIEVISPSALKNTQDINAEIVKMISNIKTVNDNMVGAKSPSGSDSAIKDLNAKLAQQDETIKRLQSSYQSLAKAQKNATVIANTTATASGRVTASTREQSVANQILRAETDRNFRANTLLAGAYARASAQLLVLKKQAKDAAITFGEESVQATKAAAAANELGGRIVAADKVVGDFQRNVGNYSGGIQKGFAAIFSNVRQLAYILPGIGIAGIFSLALDPIVEFVKQLDVFKKRINELSEAKKQLTDINKEAATSATNELISLQGNLNIAKDVTLSYKERMIAVQKLQDTYPFYFENLTKEQILVGDTAKAEIALTEAILSRSKANAAVGKITENQGKIIDLEEQRLTLVSDLSRAEAQAADTQRRAAKGNEAAAMQSLQSSNRIANAKQKIKDLDADINALNGINNRLTAYSLANQEKAIGLDYKQEKANSIKKERIKLTFDEVESEYALRLAILERQKAEIADRMNNDSASLDAKVKSRQEYSDKSIEILNAQTEKEKAISEQRYIDDVTKNALALKNKELTAKEHDKNLFDINYRFANEQQKIDSDSSLKFNQLMNEDLAFYKKIELEKRGFTEKTTKAINESNAKRLMKTANEEDPHIKKTMALRQEAFRESLAISRKQLDIDKIRELSNAKSEEEIENIIQKYKELNSVLDELKSPADKAKQAFDDYLNTLSSGAIQKGLDEIGLSSLKMFTDIDKNGQSTFDKLLEGADTFGEKFALVFQSVGDVAQDIFNKLAERSQQRFAEQYEQLEQEKEIALVFAGDSETAKAEIERQAEAKRKEIRRREFNAKKQMALFNIAVDTAQAIVAAVAQSPLTFGLPFSAIAAAIGLAQASIVQSQKAPEFWKGTENAPAGWAWTGERGTEAIFDKNDNFKGLSDKGAKLTLLEKGDKVKTAAQTAKIMDSVMFDKSLSNILSGNNIDMNPVVNVNAGGNFPENKFDELTKTIRDMPQPILKIDKNGIHTAMRNGHTTKELLDNEVSFKRQSY